jgi:hypothetical protein
MPTSTIPLLKMAQWFGVAVKFCRAVPNHYLANFSFQLTSSLTMKLLCGAMHCHCTLDFECALTLNHKGGGVQRCHCKE